MKLDPALQQILDEVDERVALAKNRWEAAYERADDRLIELADEGWHASRQAREKVYKSLQALQEHINHPGLTDEELDRLLDNDSETE